MQLLKVINPDNVADDATSDWKHRTAARAVVFDANGKIGLLHVTKGKYYKLPGGGLEEGENVEIALARECAEELGVQVKVLSEVGSVIEYRSEWKLHQTSLCFLAEVASKKNAPALTDDEKSWGFEIVWVEPAKVLKLLNLKETSNYEGKFIEERDFCLLAKALEIRKMK